MTKRTGGGLIAAQLTDVSVVNSTTETNLVNLIAPAGILQPADVLRLTVYGDFLNNSGAAVTYAFKLYFGATALLTSNAFSFSASASRGKFTATADIAMTDVAAQRAGMSLLFTAQSATALPITTGAATAAGWGSSTEDPTTAKAVRLTATLGTANASADCFARLATLVLHRP